MTTAGRKPLAQQAAPAIDPALDQDKIGGALAQMRADSMADIDAVVEAVHSLGVSSGASGAFEFMRCIADSGATTQFENVKKSKAWKFLRNTKSGDGRHFASLDEFCEVKLGKSYKRLRELSLNRSLIGQEAFEQAERLGLRQVDYNAIKTLPAPDQELMRRAVEEAQSRDEVLDLLQELAARHAKEKETASKEILQLQADKKYATEQQDKERTRAEKAEKTLASGGPRSAPVPERLADFEKEVKKAQEAASDALLEITKQLGALNDWWSEEMTQQPGYEPGDAVPTPPEVVELAQKMHDHIERIAASVGGLQRQIWENHGHEIQAARTYVMQPGVIPGHAGQAEVE